MIMRNSRHQPRSRGQIVIIFALAIIAFVGMCAVVIDVSWFWSNSLRMQRAADAAALAGVIRLPAREDLAIDLARAEAKKNGYDNGAGGVVVDVHKDSTNNRRLRVKISGPVNTFFARVLGLSQIQETRDAQAEYVLPVPMGSPENYYGVYGKSRHCPTAVTTGTFPPCATANGVTTYDDVHTPTVTPTDTGWLSAGAIKTPPVVNPNWTTTGNVTVSDNNRATTTTNGAAQAWGDFGITFPATVTAIDGIELSIEDSRDNAVAGTACTFTAALSWDNGGTYTLGAGTGLKSTPALTNTEAYVALPSSGASTDKWTHTTWTASQMNNANFRVKVTAVKATTATCPAAQIMRIDHIRIKVYYRYTADVVTNPPVFHPDANVAGPSNEVLTPRGFWGMMLAQGSETISGDAYLPKYDIAGGNVNPNYDQANYFNYAIEIGAGATAGGVWIYDPGFCAGTLALGMGDTWITGSNPMSSFYDLFDTQGTPYDLTDDTLVPGFTSGTTFRRQNGSDPTIGGSGGSGIAGCDAYHDNWYQLGTSTLTGGTTGHVYRLHVSSVDPTDATDQLSTQARNGWALFTKATGGTPPRIYGIGAMEMYTPLPSGTFSEFYLAQIEAAHAGKTMEIRLFDAGDTNGDSNIEIEIPTATGWTSTNFDYTSAKGTTNGGVANCNSLAGTNVPNVVTYSSSTPRFQGCWITINIPIPVGYTAPQQGWWKIKYNITGTGTTASDLTTWQVQIRGNPVHLILP
jgi:hypothetical protein